MLFQTFWAWLTARLAAYISAHASGTAAAIEPAVYKDPTTGKNR